MKKILYALIAAGVLCSCNSLTSTLTGNATKMDTEEATNLVVESFKKNIDPAKWKVYHLRWVEGESLENDLLFYSVTMVNPDNGCFTQTFHIGGGAAGTVGDLREAHGSSSHAIFADVKGITPEMINAAAIQKQYDAAKAMIPEEYEFKSIANYEIFETVPSGIDVIDRRNKMGEVKAKFEVNVTEKGKEIIESAGKQTLQYYEVDFEVQPDGSIKMEE